MEEHVVESKIRHKAKELARELTKLDAFKSDDIEEIHFTLMETNNDLMQEIGIDLAIFLKTPVPGSSC